MLVCWRDGGLLTLLWLALSLRLIGGRRGDLPPPGFVGQISGSLADVELWSLRPRSIRMCRLASTRSAPRWRLICVWETSRLRLPRRRSGQFWEAVGSLLPSGGGVGIFEESVSSSTILISELDPEICRYLAHPLRPYHRPAVEQATRAAYATSSRATAQEVSSTSADRSRHILTADVSMPCSAIPMPASCGCGPFLARLASNHRHPMHTPPLTPAAHHPTGRP